MKTCVICLYRHLSQHSDGHVLPSPHTLERAFDFGNLNRLFKYFPQFSHRDVSVQNICLYKKKKGDLTRKRIQHFDMFNQIFMSGWLHRRDLKDRNSVPGAADDLLGDWGQVTLTCIFFSLHKMKITVLKPLIKYPEISGLSRPCESLVNFTSVAPAPKNARAAQYTLEGIGLKMCVIDG